MKKTLLVTALLAGLFHNSYATPMKDSELTLYGVIDVGYQFTREGKNPRRSMTAQTSGHQTDSHFGLMGSEKISADLHAKFALEAGFHADTGTSENPLFDRQAWVGIAANFGELRLGRQEHVTSLLTSEIDPFNNAFGDAATGAELNGHRFFLPHQMDRLNNAVTYLGQFVNDTIRIGSNYSTEALGQEIQGSGNNNRWFGLAGNYQWNQWMIAGSYDRWYRPNGMWDNNGNMVSLGKQTNLNYWSLGTTYDFRMVKLHAGYYRSDYIVLDGMDKQHSNAWLVGLSASLSNQQHLMASYKHGKDIEAENHDLTSYALGYHYDFSKRTNFYASYTYSKIEEPNETDHWKRDELAIGVQHRF